MVRAERSGGASGIHAVLIHFPTDTMGLFRPGKNSRHRKFSYEPRYYNPDKEERLKRRMRFQSRTSRRRSPAGLLYFGMLFAMALYIYMKLG